MKLDIEYIGVMKFSMVLSMFSSSQNMKYLMLQVKIGFVLYALALSIFLLMADLQGFSAKIKPNNRVAHPIGAPSGKSSIRLCWLFENLF